jgi:hypothetical protein
MHKGKDRSGKNTNTSTWICKLCVLIDAFLLIIYMCFNMDSLVHINCRLCYCHELQAMNVFSFTFLFLWMSISCTSLALKENIHILLVLYILYLEGIANFLAGFLVLHVLLPDRQRLCRCHEKLVIINLWDGASGVCWFFFTGLLLWVQLKLIDTNFL